MVITDPAMPAPVEFDTLTCEHCNVIVRVKTDPGGFCRVCMRAICGRCADFGKCTPFEKKLDAYEKKMRFRASLGS
jgi:hypothetical protein